MKKEINILIKEIQKNIYLWLCLIGGILIILYIIPMWLLGIIFIATGCLGIVLNEVNKAM